MGKYTDDDEGGLKTDKYGVHPSTDEVLIPKIQKLYENGDEFYVGPDIYIEMYNYDGAFGSDQTLSDWVNSVINSKMNYIRLIVQANSWTENELWRSKVSSNPDIYKINSERSIFNTDGNGSYTAGVNTGGALWQQFLSGLSAARTNGVKLQIDLSDIEWCEEVERFEQSEYHAMHNIFGHVARSGADDYVRAIPLAFLHDANPSNVSFGGYTVTDPDFEEMLRGQQGSGSINSLMEEIAGAATSSGGNYHILGDGNELSDYGTSGVSTFGYSLAVLTSPGVATYAGPKALGNANLWDPGQPLSSLPSALSNIPFICIHNTLDGGSSIDRDDYIARYERVKNLAPLNNGGRLLFSTDGTKDPRPTRGDVRRLYYDLLTERKNSAQQFVPIEKVGGIGDIKIASDGDISNLEVLFTYWGQSVNNPPIVKSGTITNGGTNRIKTFTIVIDDLDGRANLNTVEFVIDGATIANFASHGAFANSAHLRFYEGNNLLQLAADNGTFSGGATISATPSDPPLNNSQVEITEASVIRPDDNKRLTLAVKCRFLDVYSGSKTFYVRVTDDNKGDAHYDTQYMSFWGSITLPAVPQYGQVRVVFSPAADATDEATWYRRTWQINGESYNSGITSAQLLTGTYTVSFTRRWGFQKPSDRTVTVLANQVTRINQTFDYAYGDVRGQVKPPAARNADAKWRLEGLSNWQLHNYTYFDVIGPKQTVHFKQIPGWSKPADFFVPIKPDLSLDTEEFGNVIYAQPAPVAMSDDPEEDPPSDGLSVNFTKLMSSGNIRVDFDGDGAADIALYRPEDGSWQVYRKGIIAYWGGGEDCYPVPADYNGDGKTDIAVYYAEKGLWSIKGIGDFQLGEPWGNPVPGDYNGDGITDLAVYSEKSGETAVMYLQQGGKSSEISIEKLSLGFVFSGDFDGDRKSDFVGYDLNAQTWYSAIKGTFQAGSEDAIPLLGDFDGDGKTDFCFFDASAGSWRMSSAGDRSDFGTDGDVPLAADFDKDGTSDIAIFRPNTGEWIVGGKKFIFGKRGDIPLAGGR